MGPPRGGGQEVGGPWAPLVVSSLLRSFSQVTTTAAARAHRGRSCFPETARLVLVLSIAFTACFANTTFCSGHLVDF